MCYIFYKYSEIYSIVFLYKKIQIEKFSIQIAKDKYAPIEYDVAAVRPQQNINVSTYFLWLILSEKKILSQNNIKNKET